MEKKLLKAGVLLLGISLTAQTTFVGNGALVTVTENTLVYNGGGMKINGTGKLNNSGNVMIVGSGTDKFETTDPATSFSNKYASATSYGQLYIDGITQDNITGQVAKEYKEVKHGAYQQIGLPFKGKMLSSLSAELSKTFNNTRYSQNEILKWDNAKVLSRNTNVTDVTADPTTYYMLGGAGLDINRAGLPYTLKGVPYANGIVNTLSGAGAGVNFGTNGSARNIYSERYSSYVDDPFVATAWSADYGKNMYQYSNPYLTNLDLSDIGSPDTSGDGNNITNLQGIIIQPSFSNVTFSTAAGSKDLSPNFITYTSGTRVPTGDVDKLVLKPLQSFTIKLSSSNSATLNYDKLRRFKLTARAETTPYSVTAAKGGTPTLKQLGVIALDADGNEMGRTYFVVYKNGVSGYNDIVSTQAIGTTGDLIKTFEENAAEGGLDVNNSAKYSLYINEANEVDFKGKPLPMALYSSEIKSLKFEIRENAVLVDSGIQNLSTGIGFYIKPENGKLTEVSQDGIFPVVTDLYNLYFGKPESVLTTDLTKEKPSRTQIAYNPAIDNYVVRFDSIWKKATIQVFDMSGRLVFSKQNVSTNQDFIIQLNKENRAYVVTAISDNGDKATAKIIR